MRIGILAEGFAEWQGGVDFLRLVCASLRLATDTPPELVLLYPRDRPGETAKKAAEIGLRWLYESITNRRLVPWRKPVGELRALSAASRIARLRDSLGELPVVRFHDDAELEAVARARGLDGLLPSYRPLEVRTPWVGYLFDFQHRHLPDLFPADERATRDARFAAMMAHASHVIVNSRAAADDCLRFLGSGGARLVVLPFGAAADPACFVDEAHRLTGYRLPERYFLVANQFWIHKNHRLVFEAVAQLATTGRAADVAVVCTGGTDDPRDPDHFPSLGRYLDQQHIADRVRILGHIPKRDQIEILKRALAVVQPTLFEGGPGGGAVYDAVALGVPALVSDLPVNRELEGQGLDVQFFDPADASALADRMATLWRAPQPPRKDAATLLEQGRQRRRAVGRVLLDTLAAAGSR
jgi:glycosyltransferase involved in cell wall biosynthesis